MPRAPKANRRLTRKWNADIAMHIEAALTALDETLGEVDPVKIQRMHREARKQLRMALRATADVENVHAIAAQRDDNDG